MDGLKYKVTAKSQNNATREFTDAKPLEDGIECDGYVIVGFKKGSPSFASMCHVSINEIMEFLRDDNGVGGSILQAAMIAKGYLDAHDIQVRCERRNARNEKLKNLADLLLSVKDVD